MAVSSSGSAGSETYAYNPGTNQLVEVTDASGSRTVSYDGRGNTVAEARPGGVTVAASYDGHARLESYDRSNIGAQTYSYNGLGDRVRVVKPTGTRHFVYDSQGRVVAEYGVSSAEVKAEFIWALPPGANDNAPFGGDDGIVGYAPLALVTTNTSSQLTLYWVHGNHLGVPIVTTNALGQVVDPGNDFLRPGFPGQSQVLSDLYYNRARDYDPVLGRYIQADPIGLLGDVNPYLYANGDPVNMIDPDGEFAQLLVPIIVGGIIGAGTDLLFQGFDNYRRGRRIFDRNCYDWNSVLISGAIGAAAGGIGRIGAVAGEGLEFSHALPGRFFRPRTLSGKNLNPEYKPLLDRILPNRFRNSRWNGNYVSKKFHSRTDPYRNLKGQTRADTIAAPWRHFLRIPTAYAYPAGGAGVVANSASNGN